MRTGITFQQGDTIENQQNVELPLYKAESRVQQIAES